MRLFKIALSLLLLCALDCGYHKGPFRPVEGQDFAAEDLSRIHKGMPAHEVLRLLGEPLERTLLDHGEQWRYSVREMRVAEKRFLGLATIKRWRWNRSTQAEILVRDGLVTIIEYGSDLTPPQ